jgi:hypothetical protein
LKTYALLLIALLSLTATSQERGPVNGKILSAYDDLEGIYIINKTADITVTSTKGGYFTINAAVNDTLIFSAIQFVSKQVQVTKQHTTGETLFVKLEFIVRDLDEVTINRYKNLTSESLGLIPKGQKRYTPAERKLATAGDMALNPMGLDPLINWMSGRTAMLKKEVQVEKRERLMDKVNYLYTEEDIVTEFKIPTAYVKGFVYYIVEDADLARAIREKNDARVRFIMNGLALKYLDLIADEKK